MVVSHKHLRASSFVTSADRGGRTMPLKSCITNDFTDKRKFHTIDMDLPLTMVSINLYCLQNTYKICEYDSHTEIKFFCRHHKLIYSFVRGRSLSIVGKYLLSMKTFVMRDSSGDLGQWSKVASSTWPCHCELQATLE